jgi:hypothetical protein
MYLLIFDGQICGQSQTEDNLPNGFSAIAYGGDLAPDRLELVDGEIREKIFNLPLPIETSTAVTQNWAGLFLSLHHTPMWERAYEASGRTLKANRAFTLLLNTLTVTRSIELLSFAIADLREAMAGISTIGDFSESEITLVNELLQAHNFDLTIDG